MAKEKEATQPKETDYKIGEIKEGRITFLQLNVDSLKAKVVELRELLKKEKVDVFLLQETKLRRKEKTPQFPGYSIYRKERQTTTERQAQQQRRWFVNGHY